MSAKEYLDPSEQRRRDPVNDVGCKPVEDVCVEHDEPLVCEHGCSMASPHCSGDPACSETEHRA
jgi:hypothetical protein